MKRVILALTWIWAVACEAEAEADPYFDSGRLVPTGDSQVSAADGFDGPVDEGLEGGPGEVSEDVHRSHEADAGITDSGAGNDGSAEMDSSCHCPAPRIHIQTSRDAPNSVEPADLFVGTWYRAIDSCFLEVVGQSCELGHRYDYTFGESGPRSRIQMEERSNGIDDQPGVPDDRSTPHLYFRALAPLETTMTLTVTDESVEVPIVVREVSQELAFSLDGGGR